MKQASLVMSLTFVLVLASCTAAAPGPGQTQAAKIADDMTIGLNVNPNSLDPAAVTNVPTRGITEMIFEPLMRLDDDLKYVPDLALRYERPNALTWRFYLRPGVRFTDGQPFDSEDVVYSMNRLLDPTLAFIDPASRTRAKDIDRVVAVDSMTVDVITKAPAGFFLNPLANFLPILPHKAASAAGAGFGIKPIGTGPYKLVELTPGQRVVLDRNDDYWGPKPPTKRLVFRPLVEDSTRVAAFEAGEVQFINNPPIDALTRLKADSRFRIEAAPSTRTIYLAIRTTRGPLQDLKVRQAIAHAIDTNLLAKSLFLGLTTSANSPFAPTVFGAAKDLPPYSYDPQLSRKLLADAGYLNGIKLSFGIPQGNYLNEKPVGEAIAGMLEKAGISTSVEQIEWATFFPTAVTNKKYDIYLFGIGSADASQMAHFLSLDVYTDWKPPERDPLMARINAGPEEQALEPLLQIQKLMWEQIPEVFLYYQPSLIAVASNVTGARARPDEVLNFRNLQWPGK